MTASPMQLAWWVDRRKARPGDTAEWVNGDFLTGLARDLERAGFDRLILADPAALPFVPLLGDATTRLGLVASVSPFVSPPFQAARALTTLDHLSAGRVGWRVTGHDDEGGTDGYRKADEFVEVVEKLWDSWDADAVLLDRETGVFADHTRVRSIDHEGEFFSVRGPLNGLRPLQGRPTLVQEGDSPADREFAARHADVIVAAPQGLDAMREFQSEVRERASLFGRDPDSISILFRVSAVLDLTDALAEAAAAATPSAGSLTLTGTPETVADALQEALETTGGDGFAFTAPGDLSRRSVDRIASGLLPELRRRGLVGSVSSTESLLQA